MTPGEALAYLQSFPDWERGTAANEETYTLDRMRRLLQLLGHPDRACGIVHVVGTKGKGSTAAMIASCLRTAGYRTGLFISPHLVDYRERVRVDGALIPPEALAAIVAERLRPAVEELRAAGEKTPLHFELLCALACEHFRRSDAAVAALSALASRYPTVQADSIRRGLAATRWPGRLQVAARDPLVLLDAAHNRESAAALADALTRLYPAQPFVLVVAMFRDKDAGA